MVVGWRVGVSLYGRNVDGTHSYQGTASQSRHNVAGSQVIEQASGGFYVTPERPVNGGSVRDC
jgi:hypothetical protein